jgi:hypothetical protein
MRKLNLILITFYYEFIIYTYSIFSELKNYFEKKYLIQDLINNILFIHFYGLIIFIPLILISTGIYFFLENKTSLGNWDLKITIFVLFFLTVIIYL